MKHLVLHLLLLLSLSIFALRPVVSQEPVADWTFVPEYCLPSKAKRDVDRIPHPVPQHELVEVESASLLFAGEKPTQRITGLLSAQAIPRERFAIEAWVLNHVNQPVGMLIAAKGKLPGQNVP